MSIDQISCITVKASSPEWGAEGLPPVGTVCEMRRTDYVDIDWQKVEFLCAGNKKAFFRDRDGHEWSRPLSDLKFRPIRTPEQIAAEDREAAIKAMMAEADLNLGAGEMMSVSDYIECSFAALYDAGWRKQVTE